MGTSTRRYIGRPDPNTGGYAAQYNANGVCRVCDLNVAWCPCPANPFPVIRDLDLDAYRLLTLADHEEALQQYARDGAGDSGNPDPEDGYAALERQIYGVRTVLARLVRSVHNREPESGLLWNELLAVAGVDEHTATAQQSLFVERIIEPLDLNCDRHLKVWDATWASGPRDLDVIDPEDVTWAAESGVSLWPLTRDILGTTWVDITAGHFKGQPGADDLYVSDVLFTDSGGLTAEFKWVLPGLGADGNARRAQIAGQLLATGVSYQFRGGAVPCIVASITGWAFKPEIKLQKYATPLDFRNAVGPGTRP